MTTPKLPCPAARDQLAAMVRAYVPPPSRGKPKTPRMTSRRKKAPVAPEWTLIFDTETKTDETQSLRFGAYQLRRRESLIEHGIFYDPDGLSPPEIQTLKTAASDIGATVITRSEFVEEVFFGKAYDLRAAFVGFNLPFDISRLANRHNSARGKMKGGFTFQLSSDPRRARIQIRHLNSVASFIQFSLPPKQRTPRGARKRQLPTPPRRGSFVDLRTIGAALFSRKFSLQSLAEHLKTASQKHVGDAHGETLTGEYVTYALQDVQVTWECFVALSARFDEHGLTETHIGKIQSEASIGKAYLRQMGIRPFRVMQPDFPPEIMGIIISTYYGGRSEDRWRRSIKQVLYCDFLSMYPTVCTLMQLWKFVIAKGVTWADSTDETYAFLETVTIADLQKRDTWLQLHTIVELKPSQDILPLRAKYNGISPTIGLNKVSSEKPIWYTLADVITSKLLTGRTPTICKAISFQPKEPQDGLKPVRIGDRDGYELDPMTDDFYKRLIDIRSEVKYRLCDASAEKKSLLDSEQQALKILANSTSYGIFVEFNVADLDDFEQRTCFGPSGEGFLVRTKKSEEPGPFLHPLVATLITGAARLMLGISESSASNAGLDWAFCDTDSMAFAKPDDMASSDFVRRSKGVVDWFEKLNPYEKPGPLLKIEAANFDTNGQIEPLFALCISSKRYVLFNRALDGTPIIRKASAHGLGHMLAPYSETQAPASIPSPSYPLHEIGVERSQYDLWFEIIRATLNGHPDEVNLDYHPALALPAMSRYAATTPAILRWLDRHNRGKSYRSQVKPFGFLSALQADPFAHFQGEQSDISRSKRQPVKPIAPFSRDPNVAARNAFDRETRQPVPMTALMSYKRALAQYHLSPEDKFLNGSFLDRGRTERRQVQITSIHHIGKEANNWEKQFFLGADSEEQIEYGAAPADDLAARVDAMCFVFGERETAKRLGIARDTLRKLRRDSLAGLSTGTIERLRRRVF